MLLHYLGKVNSSNLLQITPEKNQKACRIWQKWNVYVVIRLTGDRRIVLQHMLEVSTFRLHACTKTLVPLVNALSVILWSTLRHICCTHCFSSSVSCTRDWYTRCWMTLQILWSTGLRSGLFAGQRSGGMNAGIAREVAQCWVPVCWGIVLLKDKKNSPDTSCITWSSCFGGSKRHWS